MNANADLRLTFTLQSIAKTVNLKTLLTKPIIKKSKDRVGQGYKHHRLDASRHRKTANI